MGDLDQYNENDPSGGAAGRDEASETTGAGTGQADQGHEATIRQASGPESGGSGEPSQPPTPKQEQPSAPTGQEPDDSNDPTVLLARAEDAPSREQVEAGGGAEELPLGFPCDERRQGVTREDIERQRAAEAAAAEDAPRSGEE